MAKKWIQKSIKHPGRMKNAAKKAGMSTHAYMEKEKNAPGSKGKAAREGLTLEKMRGGKKSSSKTSKSKETKKHAKARKAASVMFS